MPDNNVEQKRNFDAKSARQWHRYLGLMSAGFAILLAITGIMLNHTGNLQLDSRFVSNDVLLNIYGINSPHKPIGYPIGQDWISKVDSNLFYSTTKIHELDEPITGAIHLKDYVFVSFEHSILILNTQKEIIEILGLESGVPAGIKKIGKGNENDIYIATTQTIMKTNVDFLSWQRSETTDIVWSIGQKIPDEIYNGIKIFYRGEGLPLERVILDLHSGRLFGRIGVYIFDAAGVLIIVLSVTGLILFFFPAAFRKQEK